MSDILNKGHNSRAVFWTDYGIWMIEYRKLCNVEVRPSPTINRRFNTVEGPSLTRLAR